MAFDRRIARLFCLVFLVASAMASSHAAEALKTYSPFDETRPRIPQEIIADKRLDQHVKVFCKSRNLRDLFADLKAKTGVRITISRSIAGERAIIYFHDRPLRDVMTEISGLFGYYWLVSGKEGAYSYDLFEDSRHASRRKQVKDEVAKEQDQLLLDVAQKCLADDKTIDRLMEKDKDYADFASCLKNTSKLFSRFGPDFLAGVIANGEFRCRASELPAEWQAALRDYGDAGEEGTRRSLEKIETELRDHGDAAGSERIRRSLDNLFSYTPEVLAATDFSVRRIFNGSSMPSFTFVLQTHLASGGTSGGHFDWPYETLDEDAAREAAGIEMPKKVFSDTPLPDEPKVTIGKLRQLPSGHGLLVGDVLEAIALQSGMDAIADYHFGEENMQAVKETPLRQLVDNTCSAFGYVCQVDGKTLRFRYGKWYLEPVLVEPPADLIERLWSALENKGVLQSDDLRELALLPDDQIKWPGFRLINGTEDVGTEADFIRLWASLSASDLSAARSRAGLPVSHLSWEQRQKLDQWMAGNAKPSEDAIGRGILTMKKLLDDPAAGMWDQLWLNISGHGSNEGMIELPATLKPNERKELIAQRKADVEAEKVEVIKQ